MSIFRAVLAVMLIAAAPLAAQTPDTASMRGQVFDQTHAAVASAEIKITSTLLGSERTTRTDASGGFSFSGLPVGSYVITAHRERFSDVTREITLLGGTTADVQLQLGISEVKTDLIVTG